MAQKSDLPGEIKELIIDALAQGLDENTDSDITLCCSALNACSVVSSEFLHYSRKYLFATITIYPGGDGYRRGRVQNLAMLFESDAMTARCVREVTIGAPYKLGSRRVLPDRDVPRLLESLPTVKRFGIGCQYGYATWGQLGIMLQLAIVKLVMSNNLTSLRLWKMRNVPLNLIIPGSALRVLELRSVNIDTRMDLAVVGTEFNSLQWDNQQLNAQLTSLRVGYGLEPVGGSLANVAGLTRYHLDLDIFHTLPFSAIKSFSADICSINDIEMITKMFSHLKFTLQDLHLCVKHFLYLSIRPPFEDLNQICLDELPCLKTISLETDYTPPDASVPHWLIDLIKFKSNSKVEKIQLGMWFFPHFEFLPENGWRELDHALTSIPTLRTVILTVKLCMTEHPQMARHELCDLSNQKGHVFRKLLPGLSSLRNVFSRLSVMGCYE